MQKCVSASCCVSLSLSGSPPLYGERQTWQEDEQISGKCHWPIRCYTRSFSRGRYTWSGPWGKYLLMIIIPLNERTGRVGSPQQVDPDFFSMTFPSSSWRIPMRFRAGWEIESFDVMCTQSKRCTIRPLHLIQMIHTMRVVYKIMMEKWQIIIV